MLYKSLFYHVSFPFLDAPSASCRKMESQAIIHSGLHLLERICFSHFSDVWLMLENLVSWKYVPLKSKRRLKRYISNGLYLNIAYKCLVKNAGHYTFVSSLLEVHLPQYVKEVNERLHQILKFECLKCDLLLWNPTWPWRGQRLILLVGRVNLDL